VNTKVSDTIAEHSLIKENASILIALSGGADSLALADFLIKRKETFKIANIYAMHINHMIRADADENQIFVESFCEDRGIQFFTERFDVPALSKESKESLELCGRRVRYEALERKAFELDALIATAHTMSDSAETVIFNLARGTGLKGLCGIPVKRENIIRPLTGVTKSEVLDYCRQNGLEWYEDSTNKDNSYSRNKIRNVVINTLSEINPNLIANISCSSELFAVDEDYMGKQASAVFENIICGNNSLKTAELEHCHQALVRRIIVLFLEKNGIRVSQKSVLDICKRLKSNYFKINICKDTFLILKNGELSAIKRQIIETKEKNVDLNIKSIQKIHKNLVNDIIDCDKIIGGICVSSRMVGDRITLQKRRVTKSLKKLFIEEKIPAEQRSSVVVLRDDEGIVWVEGFGADLRVCCDQDTKEGIIPEIKDGYEYES